MTLYDWLHDGLGRAIIIDGEHHAHEMGELCDTETGVLVKHDISHGRIRRYVVVAPLPLVVQLDVRFGEDK